MRGGAGRYGATAVLSALGRRGGYDASRCSFEAAAGSVPRPLRRHVKAMIYVQRPTSSKRRTCSSIVIAHELGHAFGLHVPKTERARR